MVKGIPVETLLSIIKILGGVIVSNIGFIGGLLIYIYRESKKQYSDDSKDRKKSEEQNKKEHKELSEQFNKLKAELSCIQGQHKVNHK